jgi:hypothetical protein
MPWRKTLVVTEEDQKLKLVSQVVHKELSGPGFGVSDVPSYGASDDCRRRLHRWVRISPASDS